jgi:hypothetical protein
MSSSALPLTFSQSFKHFRLLSQFHSLASFSDALFEEGITYDPSILSHWQRGARIPSDRNVVLTVIKIFIEKKGIKSIQEANQLLSSAQHGYLTLDEQMTLFKNQPEVGVVTPFSDEEGDYLYKRIKKF